MPWDTLISTIGLAVFGITSTLVRRWRFGRISFSQADGHPWSALYDLRLRISEKWPIVRIPEPLYSASVADVRPTGQKQFDYVDPKNRRLPDRNGTNRDRTSEANRRLSGAEFPSRCQTQSEKFPVRASVVIPVRNRERTILDAVKSALGQRADFDFNVIVVDNHSTDRTTELLRGVTRFAP